MYIEEIKLKNFRNYNEEKFKLNKKINIIYGNNAQGKTNILEAIFVASLGKSFRTNNDKELINFNKKNSEVEIKYQKKDREGKINIKIENKKTFLINNIKVKKLSELLGNIYIVMFSPENINIIKNEPAKKRKFLNIMISQVRPMYAHLINQYNKVLEERNNYLKQIKLESKPIENLEIWDEQLYKYAVKIYEYRKLFIEKINKKIEKIHFEITKEQIKIKYITDVEEKEKYFEKIKKNREIDIKKGFSNIGVHRDNFEIFINGKEISKYGSQGQQRTSIISLKLAEAEVINDEVEEKPIILLDDFMSELDENRIRAFIKQKSSNNYMYKKIRYRSKRM